MAREERKWHPRFVQYMEEIVRHPNYRGLPIEKRADGTYGWIAPKKSPVGRARIAWCREKARALGFEMKPGVYADVMLAIHPTKRKVCQTCGREMSLFYHYPNVSFLAGLNRRFGTAYTGCDHIGDIWDDLAGRGFDHGQIAAYLIEKGGLDLPAAASRDEVIGALELACRKGSKKCLGPGAMSNFPDRFDGFHSYNRCCRASQDKGRSKENLRTYTRDRRAYEYWNDGNIHAADEFMGSSFFAGRSADHIGPISLGFVHDPRYLQPMEGGDNSAKRDRLGAADIEKIIAIQRRTGVYPMSWYSKKIWEHIRENYAQNPDKAEVVYRDALKQNMANFMYVLWYILENCRGAGEAFLIDAFLRPNFDSFRYTYRFNARGEIVGKEPRHYTERSANETERYCRIAIEAVYDYREKENRIAAPDLERSEILLLDGICESIRSGTDLEDVKGKIEELLERIQCRIIAGL